jgi:predicted peptidase
MKRVFKMTLAALATVSAAALLTGCNGSSDIALQALGKTGDKGFTLQTLARGDRVRKYALFIPLHYKSTQAYPVIIFLHGLGEGGNDAHANLKVGLAPFIQRNVQEFPFICIFPQSEDGYWDENSPAAGDVIAELDAVAKKFNIDQDRVTLTGLSTGGYGTWAIGAKNKNRFAALVPMGSSADPAKFADQLINMPIWAFHNSGDAAAPCSNDSTMYNRLNTLGSHDCKYTEYPDSGHDCWDTAYGDGELFSWILQQSRVGNTTFGDGGPNSSMGRY